MSLQTSPHRRRTRRSLATLHAGTVQVSGDAIYYQTRGDCELARQTVLFVHGVASNRAVWNEVIAGLPGSYYVIAPDLPGHGESQGAGRPSVRDYSAFLLDFLNALSIMHPVVVVGHCLGAAIALDFARRADDRVAGLVISGLGVGAPSHGELLEALELGEVSEALLASRLSAGAPPELTMQELLRWHHTRPEVRYGDVAAAMAYGADLPCTGLSAPLLALAADADSLVRVEQVQALQAWYPQARVRRLAEAGHLAMLERPALYRAAVEGFLRKLVAQPPVPRSWA